MSRRRSFRSPQAAARAALGHRGFVAHCRELCDSDAWQNAPLNVRRLLQFLELEHLRHAGKENGFLVAPYNQLVAFGIGRSLIKPAINDAVRRGLLQVTHHGSHHANGRVDPSRYRLTYLQWKLVGATGPEFIPPTNEWKQYREPPKPPRRRKPSLRVVVTNE